ncbi:DUF222 domain-containing protein [Georgenia sp. SUBG003]|uniref:HNH endonuclease signature motif containing protein n=1 Tax=Georgenia sp. SUBG003 TaxID=1497974 RepID=UPI003AB8F2FD
MQREDELGQPLRRRDRLDTLTGTDLAALPSAELLEALDAAEALHRRLEALTARFLTATETDGMWATTGARSFAAWYRARTGRHHTTAHKAVRHARRLRDHLPATAEALAAGTISADHATALTTHAATTPRRPRPPHRPPTSARTSSSPTPAPSARPSSPTWSSTGPTAPTPPPPTAPTARTPRRSRSPSPPTTGGYHLAGWLTTANGQALQEALDARTGTPRRPPTPRTPPQRRAHALTALARLALDTGTLRPAPASAPHLTVHVPYDTLTRLVAAQRPSTDHPGATFGPPAKPDAKKSGRTPHLPRRRRRRPRRQPTVRHPRRPRPRRPPRRRTRHPGRRHPLSPPSSSPASPAPAPCTASSSAPTPRSSTPAAKNASSPPAQTRAIIARDRTCRYPDCHAPPGEGEIHHSIWWYEHHGTTAAHLGILLCWHHHDYVHQRNITIERTGDQWTFTRPRRHPPSPPSAPPEHATRHERERAPPTHRRGPQTP